MNDFILVTDKRDGERKAIRTCDVIEVEGRAADKTSTIWYYSYFWKRGRTAYPFEAKESIETVYAMLNGGEYTSQKEKGEE